MSATYWNWNHQNLVQSWLWTEIWYKSEPPVSTWRKQNGLEGKGSSYWRSGSLLRDPGRENFIYQLPHALCSRNGPTKETINLCPLCYIHVHQKTPLYALSKDEIKAAYIIYILVIISCAFEMEAVTGSGHPYKLAKHLWGGAGALSCLSFVEKPFL